MLSITEQEIYNIIVDYYKSICIEYTGLVKFTQRPEGLPTVQMYHQFNPKGYFITIEADTNEEFVTKLIDDIAKRRLEEVRTIITTKINEPELPSK